MLIHYYVNAKEKEAKSELRDHQKEKHKDETFKGNDEFADIMNKLSQFKNGELDPEDPANYEDGFGAEGEDSDFEEPNELIFTAGDLELYDSPLEKVDSAIYFKQVMEEIDQNDNAFYEQLVGCISSEDKLKLKNDFIRNDELLKIEKSNQENE